MTIILRYFFFDNYNGANRVNIFNDYLLDE